MKKIGRYEIVEELGRGAMGVVYKASDPTIGRMIAIKVLSLDSSKEEGIPGAREIFMREARAAGRLSHPGIVTIHDALEDQETKSSYIVMEFVAGRTLENILINAPPPTVEKGLGIIRQIAEALEYAHQQQIIHRDLKPANILIAENGHVKITDFGIAKIAAREGAMRTVAVMGTPAYMSPEQVTGGEVDIRSDLFSMGILLYLLLTGQKPFAGDTAAVMFKIVYEDPVPPTQIKPDLSAGHDYLVLRCLAKDRNKRYSTAREFLDDLEDVGQGRPPRSEEKVPLSELRAGERTMMVGRSPFAGPEPLFGAKKLNWIIAGAGGLALLASLIVAMMSWHIRPSPPPVKAGPPAAASTATSATSPATGPQTTSAASQPPAKPGAPTKPGSKPAVQNPIAASPASKTPPKKPGAAGGQPVELVCRYALGDALLTISNETGTFFHSALKGKKKGGFLGIGKAYQGALSRPIRIPPGSRELTVQVVSADNSVNLNKKITATPPAGRTVALHVLIGEDQLTVHWSTQPHPAE